MDDRADRPLPSTVRLDRLDTDNGLLVVRRFEGSAPAVLALHGFGLHGGQFGPLARAGAGAVDAPDLPGHGLSTIEPVDLDTTMAALAAWLRPIGPTQVLGYSQGGRLALQLAWRHPDLVESLVVVSAGSGLDEDTRAERADADAVTADRIERDGVAAYLDGWLDHPVFGTTRLDPVSRAVDRALRLENAALGLAAARRGLGQGALPRVPVEDLAVPILWVAGGLDHVYAATMSALAGQRGEHLHIVPGVGHNVVAEAPAAIFTAVDRWPPGG